MKDQTKKFFDKKSPEEDIPVEVEDSVQVKYSKINEIYDEFFEENTITLAKVSFKIIKAMFQGRTRVQEA